MLKGQLEGVQTKKEELANKLQEKDNEIKIIHERLNKESLINLKFNKSSPDLENLLNKQRDHNNREGIIFRCNLERGETSNSHKRKY